MADDYHFNCFELGRGTGEHRLNPPTRRRIPPNHTYSVGMKYFRDAIPIWVARDQDSSRRFSDAHNA